MRISRCRSQLKFTEMWDAGPPHLEFGPSISAADAHGMRWFYFVLRLAHTRPLPRHVRSDPMFLAGPLSREADMPLDGCLRLVEMLMKKTKKQIQEEFGELE